MARQQTLLLIGITFSHALSHAFVLAFPALFPFIREDLILTYKDLGLLWTVLLVTYGLTPVPSGWLSDVIGTKSVLIAYLVILSISSFTLRFVMSFPVLLVLVGVIGLTAGLYHPPGLSLISQSFPSEDLGKMFGVHGVSGSVGTAIAPGVTALVASTKYGWRSALLPFGLFSLLAIPFFLALSSFTQRDATHGKSPNSPNALNTRFGAEKAPVIHIRPLVVILALSALVGLIDSGMVSFLNVYLVDDRNFSPAAAGFVVTGILAIAIAGQIAFGVLTDSKGPVPAFRIAALAVILLFFLIPFSPRILLLGSLIFAAFAITGTQPPLNTLTTNVSSLEKRGTVFGLQFISVFGVGGGIAGFLAGIIASLYGLDAIYLVLSGFGALLLILLLIYPRWSPTPT